MLYADYEDVAQELRVTTKTITNLVDRGELPKPAKLGRKPLWVRHEIFQYIELKLSIDSKIKELKEQLSEEKTMLGAPTSSDTEGGRQSGKRKRVRLTHKGQF